MKRLFYILFILCFCPFLKAQNESTELVRFFDNLAKESFAISQVPGVAIAIVMNGQTIYLKGFGSTSLNDPKPITPTTVFRLASLSKFLTSVMLLAMQQQGDIDLSHPIVHDFPEFSLSDPLATSQINMYHILSQTTGLPRHTYTNLIEDGQTLEDLTPRLSEVKLLAPLGKIHSYQNVIYSLADPYLRKAKGISYATAMQKYLFTPLQMVSSSVGLEAFSTLGNTAKPHIRAGAGYRQTTHNSYYEAVLPAAGINASAADLAEFMKGVLGKFPQILNANTLRMLYTPLVRTPEEMKRHCKWKDRVKSAHYSLGCRVYDYHKEVLIGHGGWLRGYNTRILLMPHHKVGIAILVNGESRLIDVLWTQFFDKVLNLPEKPWKCLLEKKPIKRKPHLLKKTHKKSTIKK